MASPYQKLVRRAEGKKASKPTYQVHKISFEDSDDSSRIDIPNIFLHDREDSSPPSPPKRKKQDKEKEEVISLHKTESEQHFELGGRLGQLSPAKRKASDSEPQQQPQLQQEEVVGQTELQPNSSLSLLQIVKLNLGELLFRNCYPLKKTIYINNNNDYENELNMKGHLLRGGQKEIIHFSNSLKVTRALFLTALFFRNLFGQLYIYAWVCILLLQLLAQRLFFKLKYFRAASSIPESQLLPKMPEDSDLVVVSKATSMKYFIVLTSSMLMDSLSMLPVMKLWFIYLTRMEWRVKAEWSLKVSIVVMIVSTLFISGMRLQSLMVTGKMIFWLSSSSSCRFQTKELLRRCCSSPWASPTTRCEMLRSVMAPLMTMQSLNMGRSSTGRRMMQLVRWQMRICQMGMEVLERQKGVLVRLKAKRASTPMPTSRKQNSSMNQIVDSTFFYKLQPQTRDQYSFIYYLTSLLILLLLVYREYSQLLRNCSGYCKLFRKNESIPVSNARQMTSTSEALQLPLSTMLSIPTPCTTLFGSYKFSFPSTWKSLYSGLDIQYVMQPEIGSTISPLMAVSLSTIQEGCSTSCVTTGLQLICSRECSEYSSTQSVGKVSPLPNLKRLPALISLALVCTHSPSSPLLWQMRTGSLLSCHLLRRRQERQSQSSCIATATMSSTSIESLSVPYWMSILKRSRYARS